MNQVIEEKVFSDRNSQWVRVGFLIKREEKESIRKAAQQVNVTMSEYIRRLHKYASSTA